MRYLLSFLLLGLPFTVSAENIEKSDLVGSWIQEREITKGERMMLKIEQDLSAELSRDFANSQDQNFRSIVMPNEGIWIMDFESNREFGYKVVVAGWKQGQTTALFGTIYMYRNGEVFNGVPISFRKDS